MSYQMQVIYNHLQVLDDYVDLVDNKVLEPYKTEIMRLPQDEQKTEWYKYTLINNLITQAIETVRLMHTEIENRHTKSEIDFKNKQIAALQKYIRVLGGNPSIINHTINTDL
jgi:hypothetical protein